MAKGVVQGTVAIVASEHRLKLGHALRSGLEAMGLGVILVESASELAGRATAFDHIIYCETVDESALDLEDALTIGPLSSTLGPPVDHSKLRTIQSVAVNNLDVERGEFVVSELLNRVCTAKGVMLRIAPSPAGGYHATGALATGEEGEIAPLTPDDSSEAIRHFALIGDIPGNVLGTQDVLTGFGIVQFGQRLLRVDVQISGVIGLRSCLVGLEFLNARQVERLEKAHADHRDSPDVRGVTLSVDSSHRDEPLIIQFLNTLLYSSWRLDASGIIVEPDMGGAEILLCVADSWVRYDKIPAPYADPVIQRIRAGADLLLSNRRVVQHGQMDITAAGEDVRVIVTITPTSAGDRVEMRLRYGAEEKVALAAPKKTGLPQASPLSDKLVMLVGGDEADQTLPLKASKLSRRVIATTGPVDSSTILLFILMFYRSLTRQGDERAAFKKAKTAVLTDEDVKMYD